MSYTIDIRSTIIIGIILLCMIQAGEAHAPRFTEFFDNSATLFLEVSEKTCNATRIAFENAYNSHAGHTAWIDLGISTDKPIFDLCRAQVSCILNHVSEATKASLGTANIVLGLLPTLLAVLAPSISELALLSAQRPLLALVLSVGAPGLLQTKIFAYEDPTELLDPPEVGKTSVRAQMVLGPWSGKFAAVVGVSQWVLAIACAANTVILAVQISHRSVLSWGCTRTWPVLVWVFVPFVIHGISAMGYRMTLEKRQLARHLPSSEPVTQHAYSSSIELTSGYSKQPKATTLPHNSRDQPKVKQQGVFTSWLRREVTSCAHRTQTLEIRMPQKGVTTRARIGVFITCVSGFLSFFFLLYGTVTLSSLLFIDTLDAIGQIAMRFLGSAIICRFIVLLEMGGMRGAMWAASEKQ